ncbi:MAG: prolyl-tRNA synthetase associated domain-containing protein [Pseudomonadota bacterium]
MLASPATPDDLFAYLDRLGIAHTTVWHDATFTVDEGRDLKATIPGGHSKNLFMKDKDDALVLVSAHADSVLKLNQLHKVLGTRRLSFGAPDLMQAVLGVVPGSVTSFALMNDKDLKVRFIAEAALMAHDTVNFHPLVNTGTTSIARDDLIAFAESTGHAVEVIDFAAL